MSLLVWVELRQFLRVEIVVFAKSSFWRFWPDPQFCDFESFLGRSGVL